MTAATSTPGGRTRALKGYSSGTGDQTFCVESCRSRSRRIPSPRPPRPTTTAFDRAAERLVKVAGSKSGIAAVEPEDYRTVSATLERFARGLRLSPDEAAEVVAEVVMETITRASADAGREVREPGAYLYWTTRNRALDRLRRAQLHRTEPLDNEALERGTGGHYSEEDETIVRFLERDATTDRIARALRAAAAADDQVVVRVVTLWLELAEELGREPTSREVAPEAQTSHTTVNNALRRLRAYLRLGEGEATLEKSSLSRRAIRRHVMALGLAELRDEARRWRTRAWQAGTSGGKARNPYPQGHTRKSWRDVGESIDAIIPKIDALLEAGVPESAPRCKSYRERLVGYCILMRDRNGGRKPPP